jgi:gelsolin
MLPEDEKKMYTMVTTRGKVLESRSEDGKQLIVREIPLEGLVMRQGIVYVLDKGPLYWQYNTKKSTAWTRYKAAEYMMYLGQWRVPQTKFQVFGERITRLSCDSVCIDDNRVDEGTPDEGEFLEAAGITSPVMDVPLPPIQGTPIDPPLLYQLIGDESGWQVAPVAAQRTSLQSDGVYIMDDHGFPAVYTWLGKNVPEPKRRLALQYAQNYLNDKRTKEGEHVQVATTLVKVNEDAEPASFLDTFNPRTL